MYKPQRKKKKNIDPNLIGPQENRLLIPKEKITKDDKIRNLIQQKVLPWVRGLDWAGWNRVSGELIESSGFTEPAYTTTQAERKKQSFKIQIFFFFLHMHVI